MADSITKCLSFYKPNEELDYRIVHYHLEYSSHVLETTVLVRAAEMTDPEDLDECRTLANEKAAIIKDTWIGSIANPTTEEELSDLNGSVSL